MPAQIVDAEKSLDVKSLAEVVILCTRNFIDTVWFNMRDSAH